MSAELVHQVRGPRGAAAIAAGSAAAAQSGAEVLAQGGNAVDAVIAATATACIAEPGLTSLGGGGFLMARDPDGAVTLMDFFVAVPGLGGTTGAHPDPTELVVRFAGAEQTFRIGPSSVAIPGVIDGLVQCHRRLGKIPMARVLAPSVRVAREGVVPDPAQTGVLRLLTDVLSSSPAARDLYTDGGHPWPITRPLVNARLATVLEAMGSGAIGGFADHGLLTALLEALGPSVVSEQDAQAYAVIEREPITVALDDAHGTAALITNPPPSFGGRIVADALRQWGDHGRGLAGLPHFVASAAAQVKSSLEEGGVRTGTTHVSAIDAAGGVASMTTSNGSCSGVVLDGYGIQLNNMMGERDLHPGGFHVQAAGTRLRSMMSPTLLERSEGSVFALGSGGSERIRSALSSVAARLVSGQDLAPAIAAARTHLDDHEVLHVEPGLSDSEVEAIVASGSATGARPSVNRWLKTDLFFGGVNAVHRRPDGSVEAVADRRRGGVAILVDLG